MCLREPIARQPAGTLDKPLQRRTLGQAAPSAQGQRLHRAHAQLACAMPLGCLVTERRVEQVEQQLVRDLHALRLPPWRRLPITRCLEEQEIIYGHLEGIGVCSSLTVGANLERAHHAEREQLSHVQHRDLRLQLDGHRGAHVPVWMASGGWMTMVISWMTMVGGHRLGRSDASGLEEGELLGAQCRRLRRCQPQGRRRRLQHAPPTWGRKQKCRRWCLGRHVGRQRFFGSSFAQRGGRHRRGFTPISRAPIS